MRLAVFDLDGTLVDGDSHVALLRARLLARETRWRTRGELLAGGLLWAAGLLDNRWTKAVAARALAGTEVAALEQFVSTTIVPRVRPTVAARVRADREAGYHTLLLSASLDLAVAPVARALGFDFVAATPLEVTGTTITGRLAGENLHGEAKARHLEAFARAHGAELSRSRGYGDSHADRFFLEKVGEPHAVAPDRRLHRLARARGWPILS